MSISQVVLEPFTKVHVKPTFEWVKDPELRRMFLMRGEPTWQGHKAYFKKVLADPTQHVYAILSNGVHIGNCGIKNVSPAKKEGELWIYIGDVTARGKGISKKATELLIRQAFELYRLEMVYVHVAEFNTIAQGLYKRLGFIEVPLDNTSEWTNREGRVLRMELRKA